MAIDSKANRRSAGGLKPFKKTLIPDGTLGVYDRRAIACLYCGIIARATMRDLATFTGRDVSDFTGRDLSDRGEMRDIT